MDVTTVSIAIFVIALALFALAMVSWRIAGPSEAYVVTRPMEQDFSNKRVIMAGGGFVAPLLQRVHVVDLSSRLVALQLRGATCADGEVDVDAAASVTVATDHESIRSAAQRFSNREHEIDQLSATILADSMRRIVRASTPEALNRDRAAFGERVAESSRDAFARQGLSLDSLQIQEIGAVPVELPTEPASR